VLLLDKYTLLAYQPDYYKDSKVMDNINNANAIELNLVNDALQDVHDNFFLDTATTSLERWEKELGLPIANNYNTDYRRSKIYSKKKGQYTITPNQIKIIAESYENGEVDVIQDYANYSFTIKFVGKKGIPPNLDDLKDAIEELKPAHLAVVYEFTYLSWDEHDNYNKTWDTWDNLNLTWDAYETYKEGAI
jgi:uncharacterized protein YmfQ (DUF2313 family)